MSSKNQNLSKLRYLIQKHYEVRGEFPKIDWLASKMKLSRGVVVNLLRELEQEGFISRNHAQYFLNQKPAKKEPAPPPPTIKEVREKVKDVNWPILLIRIVMAVVASGAAVMSLYYTANWLFDFLPPILAWMLSGIMILFSVFAFEAIVYAWQTGRKWLSFVLAFPWIVAVLFSMTSTVAVQYNSQISAQENKKVYSRQKEANDRSAAILDNLTRDLESKRARLTRELDTYQEELEEYASKEERVEEDRNNFYWDAYRKVQRTKEELKGVEEELAELREKQLKSVEEGEEPEEIYVPSFFAWIESLFGIRGDMVQFWLSVFPAIFIDIIAPLALAIALFLHKKSKEGE